MYLTSGAGLSNIYFGNSYSNARGMIRSDPVDGSNLTIAYPNLSGNKIVIGSNGIYFTGQVYGIDATAKFG